MNTAVSRRAALSVLAAAMVAIGCTQPSSVRKIEVDLAKRKPISPYIYGANFPDWKAIGLDFPLVRQGGNRMTAYNWETNASNAGNDYRHQNDGYMGESDEPGLAGRKFLEESQSHGAATLLTIPMAGYVSADKKADGDVNQTPDYLNTRFFKSYAKKPGPFSLTPNVNDRAVYQDEYVNFLQSKAKRGLPVWYALDNEPDIWIGTHARITPTAPTYASILERSIEWAKAIKAVAPKSLVMGPCSYGWNGYRTFQNAKDANGRDFLDFYLSGMREAERTYGKRLLDTLELHYYPEARGDNVRICEGEDKPGTPAARIQATRSLWDPTYVETSWITQSNGGKPLVLIPDTMKRIAANYPGTKLMFGEYNWGGGKVISGAIAQADFLGILGRYEVFAATHWVPTADNYATIAGFRAFMNFDGAGAKFGATGLEVIGEKASDESVYAALDGKNRLTLVVINKTSSPANYVVSTRGFKGKSAKAYRFDTKNLRSSLQTEAVLQGESVSISTPALSITSLEITR